MARGQEEVRVTGIREDVDFRPPPSLPYPVDLNTVQVTNMSQLHSFVFEDCHKYYFNSIQDADSMSTGSLSTTVVRPISIRSSSCPLVVCGKNL